MVWFTFTGTTSAEKLMTKAMLVCNNTFLILLLNIIYSFHIKNIIMPS